MRSSWEWEQASACEQPLGAAGPWRQRSDVHAEPERMPLRWCIAVNLALSLIGWAAIIGAGWLVWNALGPLLA